jgi:hypothetical protein
MKFRKSSAVYVAVLVVVLAGITYSFVFGLPGDSAASATAEGSTRDVEVLETMDGGGYTYVRVKTTDGERWAAGPQTQVRIGDRVVLPSGMRMADFHSETLNRTFDEIYFVGAIGIVDGAAVTGAAAAGHAANSPQTAIEIGSIETPEGGSTIAELYAAKGELAGKQVIVRGRVVKFTANVMGRNWIHIQDGSGAGDSDDLTVTTDATVNLGDIVMVRGTAATEKDFGAGYSYTLIVEQATVDVE